MVNEPKIALNVKSIVLINSENMLTIGRCGDNIEDTDKFTCTDIFSGKQSLSVDLAISHVE